MIAIRGTVQGVGFRPFVHQLASALELGGFVRNHAGGVDIEVEGDAASLDRFLSQLLGNPPPLANIEDWTSHLQTPRGDRRFRIDASDRVTPGPVVITPDAATCDACLAEMFDPSQRRYRYPFTNCTHCGPRLTIVTGAPYDREQTTMSRFPMCRECRAEYENPADRRFHAQPIACPQCGPRLSLLGADGRGMAGDDSLARFIGFIAAGKIGAVKGLGGYHLVCDARNPAAVAELRRRKHRDEKPFAVMVRDLTSAGEICRIEEADRKLLSSTARPIVLLPKRAECKLADAVAPGNPFLGLMLPYTPLHHLLLHDMNGAALVMTSGNQSDEPIAHDEPDVTRRLRDIADVYLTHDRAIHVRCDDSVTRAIGGVESPIRRSRGHAPRPIPLPVHSAEPLLAVGGQMKATFALAHDRRAILSHHLGDLDNFQAFTAFEKDVALFEKLFSIHPTRIAHDLHPGYASTRYALDRQAKERQVTLLPIQHHHAHMASCMAENDLRRTVIGVTLDGTGFGTDGAIWGGEFLVGDYRGFRRAAHLRYVGLPGGDKAVREPWRVAAAYLHDAGVGSASFEARFLSSQLRTIHGMIERRFNTPLTSSAGRLFDAVASLAGVRDRVTYEGQAAMELEWLAMEQGPAEAYPTEVVSSAGDSQAPLLLDSRPMIRAIADDLAAGVSQRRIARRFHTTWVNIILRLCRIIREQTNLRDVVFSGGVFMNALLSVEAESALTADGFRVYRHHYVPPNDGGLSLGQLAIAASQTL